MFDRYICRFLFALLILPLSGCASLRYSAEPIEAWVVDVETQQPLEGVIVVAAWTLEANGLYWDWEKWELAGSIHQGSRTGALQVFETVTDQSGRFAFPAWGPIKTSKGRLIDEDPKLIFFKSGYGYGVLANSLGTGGIDRERVRNPVRWSNWSGKTIKLQLYNAAFLEASREQELNGYLTAHECQHWMERGQITLEKCLLSVAQCQQLVERQVITPEECHADRQMRKEKQEKEHPLGTVEEEYAKDLSYIGDAISFVEDDCNWTKTPKMILALHKQAEIFSAAGISRGPYSIYSIPTTPASEAKCGSPQEFFRRFAQ